jgi:Fe-S cluster assembly protein SufD
MLEVMEEKGVYLANFAQFEKTVAEQGPPWLHPLRSMAIDRFAELGFPTLHDEEWRFTNLAPLTRIPFQLARETELDQRLRKKLQGILDESGPSSLLVFVNGRWAPHLSSLRPLPDGVTVSSLAAVLQAHPEWVEPHLARYADCDERPFTALNTAFLHDGAFISVPRGKVVAEPIHVVFVSTAREHPTVSHPRNLILAGVNSQATIVESYLGADNNVYFTNVVTEVITAENAVLDHYKLQRESTAAFHIGTLQVYMGRSSNFTNHSISIGGGLVRNDVNAVLDAEGSECTLNGLYLGSDWQLIDNHTRIDHAKPHCASHELYKGILDGKAHGVFNGKIYVHQDAQKTDAKQTNKTLLLSPDAVIDSKPQLEIFADDVKCTHGATIGQLTDEAIFYLRSRGLGRDDARRLLTFAFANDIIGRIKVEPIRVLLEQALLATQGLATHSFGGSAQGQLVQEDTP